EGEALRAHVVDGTAEPLHRDAGGDTIGELTRVRQADHQRVRRPGVGGGDLRVRLGLERDVAVVPGRYGETDVVAAEPLRDAEVVLADVGNVVHAAEHGVGARVQHHGGRVALQRLDPAHGGEPGGDGSAESHRARGNWHHQLFHGGRTDAVSSL